MSARPPGFVRRFARNRGALIGLAILLAVIAFAAVAPMLYPQSPFRMVGRPFLAPFALERFPLGTDPLGRDVAAGWSTAPGSPC
jgi:peptide/nickel transport system permease protein